MNKNPWKIFLLTGLAFLLTSTIYLIDKKYLLCIVFLLIALSYIFSSISNYKKAKKSKINKDNT